MEQTKSKTATGQLTEPPYPFLLKILGKKWMLWLGVAGAAVLLVLGFFDTGDTAVQSVTETARPEAGEYEQLLEVRLTQLLTQVEGAGQVSVMVTLESTAQTVFAQTTQETSDTATEPDSASSRSSYSTDYVLIGDAGGKQALAETTLQPMVKGVAVVCSGADDIRVVSRITELVSTVLGIASNRICVTK